jgi:hypothetical protein
VKPTKVFHDIAEALRDKMQVIALVGSARSSKTTSLIQTHDVCGLWRKSPRKFSIVSQSLPHLKDGVLDEYRKYQIREGVTREHNKGDKVFKVGDHTLINYFSLDVDGNKAIGPGRDWLWVNEPNRGVSFQAYNDMTIRTTEVTFLDWNPSGSFWDDGETNNLKMIMEHPKTRVLHSTFLDNIDNLSKAQIEMFIHRKRLSKKIPYWAYWWKVFGEGQHGVLLEERIMPHLTWVKAPPDDAVKIPNGLDFGFFPAPTAHVELWVRPKSKTGKLMDDLYIKVTLYNQKLSINSRSPTVGNLVDALEAKGIDKRHKTIAESAEPRNLEDMRSSGYSIEGVVKTGIESSIPLFHDYNIHFVEGAASAKGYKEFDEFKYKRNKKGVLLGIPEDGQPDHVIDAVRYVLLSRNKRWSIK